MITLALKNRPLLLALFIIASMMGCKPRFAKSVQAEGWFFNHPVTMTVLADSRDEFKLAANLAMAEIKRLEESFNPINPQGPLYALNTKRTSTDAEMYWLLKRASIIMDLTGKKFNPLAGLLEEAYGFNNLFPLPPTPNRIREIMLPIGRATMEFLESRTKVKLDVDTYYVSLTAIQEGYTADQALAHLMIAGISEAKVEIGPYIACGSSPDGLGWEIKVPNQAADNNFTRLYVENSGVAVASRFDNAYEYRNRSYFNHLDAETGLPGNRFQSVAVVAPNCELAGELAQGMFLMAPEDALVLLNNMTGVEGMIIDIDGVIMVSDSMHIWMEE